MKKIFLALIIVVVIGGIFAAPMPKRHFLEDVQTKVGRNLTVNEIELAQYYFVYSMVRRNYKIQEGATINQSASWMTPEDYEATVYGASKFCVSTFAKIGLKIGRFGEKSTKALIMGSEEAMKNANKWVDEKSSEYDTTH